MGHKGSVSMHYFLEICINNFISNIMKHDRNEDLISGWANESDPNLQIFTLRNIAKPKTTVTLLPQITFTETKLQSNYRKELSNRQLPTKCKNTISDSNHAQQMKRKHTERIEKQQNAYTKPNNNKLYDIVKQQSSQIHIQPLHHAKRSQAILQRYSRIPEDEQFHRYNQAQIDENTDNFTLRKSKKHGNNTKSHDFIINALKKGEKMKRTDMIEQVKMTEMKFYVKLNTLQMVSDVRKQVKEQSFHKPSLKHCFSQQRSTQIMARKKKGSTKLGTETIQKMNQKMKQTFIKQDVFKKGQHQRSNRTEKFQSNLQFSDQLIFSNHFAAVEHSNASQVLQSKLQLLHLPQRHRLIFK